VLEVEALLAERSGQDAEAITALDRLLAVPKPKEAWLLRRAALQYRRGDLPRAQAGLAAVEKQMPSTATGYWQTYAELSRLLNLTETAQRAYQVLMDGNTYSRRRFVELRRPDPGTGPLGRRRPAGTAVPALCAR
jgi:predicted Zn-dependent protease